MTIVQKKVNSKFQLSETTLKNAGKFSKHADQYLIIPYVERKHIQTVIEI